MSRALFRRVAFVIGIGTILGVAIGGTIVQRRSVAEYARARSSVRAELQRYEKLLANGESREHAAAALRAAGAEVRLAQGDLVVTVLRELSSASRCRSLVGQLHVAIDPQGRVDGWESPPLDAECD